MKIKMNFKKLIFKLLFIIVICIQYSIITFADKGSTDNDMYTEKTEFLNDGYYYKLKFKKEYSGDGEFYGWYEDLYVDEFLVENISPDIKPFTIKASMFGWTNFKCQYNSSGDSIFYIMDLNNIRYIRVYKKSDTGHYYDLYSENGKIIESLLNVCDYIGEDKKFIIIQDGIKTEIYNLDYKKVIEFKKKYNHWELLKGSNEDKDLIYLGTKDDKWNFESGGVVFDKNMNIVYDNLEYMPRKITDREISISKSEGASVNMNLINSYNDASYRYILISKSVNNVKFKNRESVGETFIIDLDLNKVFSSYKKFISETEYYLDGEHTVLLIFDGAYYILDDNMNVIETGDPNDKEFKDKKEMNDFNSKTSYEFKPN